MLPHADTATALGIVAELKHIQKTSGAALLIIDHRDDLVEALGPSAEDTVLVTPKVRGPRQPLCGQRACWFVMHPAAVCGRRTCGRAAVARVAVAAHA